MPRILGQDDMEKIFRVVDDLGISREEIRVPLAPKGDGQVERAGGMIRIVVPETTPLDDWLPTLRARIEEL